jgi:hypothetical protein
LPPLLTRVAIIARLSVAKEAAAGPRNGKSAATAWKALLPFRHAAKRRKNGYGIARKAICAGDGGNEEREHGVYCSARLEKERGGRAGGTLGSAGKHIHSLMV